MRRVARPDELRAAVDLQRQVCHELARDLVIFGRALQLDDQELLARTFERRAQSIAKALVEGLHVSIERDSDAAVRRREVLAVVANPLDRIEPVEAPLPRPHRQPAPLPPRAPKLAEARARHRSGASSSKHASSRACSRAPSPPDALERPVSALRTNAAAASSDTKRRPGSPPRRVERGCRSRRFGPAVRGRVREWPPGAGSGASARARSRPRSLRASARIASPRVAAGPALAHHFPSTPSL